jgi:hypothetical protein
MNKTSKNDPDAFDKTLTDEERAAPSFTEWCDTTLARGVRCLAAQLCDSVGFDGVTGMAAGLALEKIARDHNLQTYTITIDHKTEITVKIKG